MQIAVDGQTKSFLLGTGAAALTIINDEQIKIYISLETVESKGTSGIALAADFIQLEKISMGQYAFQKNQLKRTDRSILGIHLLGEQILKLLCKIKKLDMLSELPRKSLCLDVRRVPAGHFTISLSLGNTKTDVLFDTHGNKIPSEAVTRGHPIRRFLPSHSGIKISQKLTHTT